MLCNGHIVDLNKNLTCGMIRTGQDPVSKFARGLASWQQNPSCQGRTILINHAEACGDTLRVRVLDSLMEEGSA